MRMYTQSRAQCAMVLSRMSVCSLHASRYSSRRGQPVLLMSLQRAMIKLVSQLINFEYQHAAFRVSY